MLPFLVALVALVVVDGTWLAFGWQLVVGLVVVAGKQVWATMVHGDWAVVGAVVTCGSLFAARVTTMAKLSVVI